MDELVKLKSEKDDTLEATIRDSGCECRCNGCGCAGGVLKESIKSNLEMRLSLSSNIQQVIPDYKSK